MTPDGVAYNSIQIELCVESVTALVTHDGSGDDADICFISDDHYYSESSSEPAFFVDVTTIQIVGGHQLM